MGQHPYDSTCKCIDCVLQREALAALGRSRSPRSHGTTTDSYIVGGGYVPLGSENPPMRDDSPTRHHTYVVSPL